MVMQLMAFFFQEETSSFRREILVHYVFERLEYRAEHSFAVKWCNDWTTLMGEDRVLCALTSLSYFRKCSN